MRTLKRWFWLPLLVLTSGHAVGQTAWTQCGVEDSECVLATQKEMRYGQPWTPAWTTPRVLGPGVIPCTNVHWGDPSPGTGKLCQVRDMDALPPPVTGQLPALTSGENYVVTWGPPSTNTDGTFIGTISKTEVHASNAADFATYYSWDVTVPTANNVSVVNGPTGTVYWRARVTTADGVSDWSATAVSERQWVSQTKPTCWPKPFGSGTWMKAAQNSDGFALYWQCSDVHAGFVGTWSSLAPDWMAQLSAAIAAGSFNTLWDTNIIGPSQASKYATVQPLWAALRDANPLPTGPVYVVRPNLLNASRPAYVIADGVRTTVIAGRVSILDSAGNGTLCDCDEFKAGNFCAVTGQPNVAARATGVLGPSAAVCVIAP